MVVGGASKPLVGFYTTGNTTDWWNCEITYSEIGRPTLDMLLYSSKGEHIYFSNEDSTAVAKEGTVNSRISIQLSAAAATQGVTLQKAKPETPDDHLIFYKSGEYGTTDGVNTIRQNLYTTTYATIDSWTFYLHIHGVSKKFVQALPHEMPGHKPGASNAVCAVAPPSSIIATDPCQQGTYDAQLQVATIISPIAVPTDPGGSSSASSSRPSSPGKTTKDPPGQNVMLVVLLLGAVLALSNCMPCK